MKKYIFLILLIMLFPDAVCAQQTQETPAQPANTTPTAQTGTQRPNNATPGQTPRRRRRTIQNREFDEREKIVLLLSAHCEFPTKEDLLSTSPEVEKHLQSIIDDKDLLLTVRMRAVEALAYFATPMNQETLEQILENPEKAEHQLMVYQAIRAYAKIAPDKAPAVLEPYLSSNVDFYRFVAITSLRDCPGQAALKVLQDRYQVETNRYFQTRLKQAIDNHCKGDTYCQN